MAGSVLSLARLTASAAPRPPLFSPQPLPMRSAQLVRDLFSAPTAIKRFQRLLVQGGTPPVDGRLFEGIVFDFNGAQPAGGVLGATKSAVSISRHLDLNGKIVKGSISSKYPSLQTDLRARCKVILLL